VTYVNGRKCAVALWDVRGRRCNPMTGERFADDMQPASQPLPPRDNDTAAGAPASGVAAAAGVPAGAAAAAAGASPDAAGAAPASPAVAAASAGAAPPPSVAQACAEESTTPTAAPRGRHAAAAAVGEALAAMDVDATAVAGGEDENDAAAEEAIDEDAAFLSTVERLFGSVNNLRTWNDNSNNNYNSHTVVYGGTTYGGVGQQQVRIG